MGGFLTIEGNRAIRCDDVVEIRLSKPFEKELPEQLVRSKGPFFVWVRANLSKSRHPVLIQEGLGEDNATHYFEELVSQVGAGQNVDADKLRRDILASF